MRESRVTKLKEVAKGGNPRTSPLKVLVRSLEEKKSDIKEQVWRPQPHHQNRMLAPAVVRSPIAAK